LVTLFCLGMLSWLFQLLVWIYCFLVIEQKLQGNLYVPSRGGDHLWRSLCAHSYLLSPPYIVRIAKDISESSTRLTMHYAVCLYTFWYHLFSNISGEPICTFSISYKFVGLKLYFAVLGAPQFKYVLDRGIDISAVQRSIKEYWMGIMKIKSVKASIGENWMDTIKIKSVETFFTAFIFDFRVTDCSPWLYSAIYIIDSFV
jgi:hypothetical protein